MNLEDLGFDQFFKDNLEKLTFSDFEVARVVSEGKGVYKVRGEKGEFLAKVRGKHIFNATSKEDYPAVGDWVVLEEVQREGDQVIIKEILPRKTVLKRKQNNRDEVQLMATNVDVAFVVVAVDRDFSLNRYERYFSMVREGGAEPVAVLNKIDLISEEEQKEKREEIEKRLPGAKVVLTSTVNKNGLEELKKQILQGKTFCFLGSSGVGKSSLINSLLKEKQIEVQSIGEQSSRGKHTTTKREMYFLSNGGIVIDNPGIREVGLTSVDSGIDSQFDKISHLARECKFNNCSHVHEPGCAVLGAVESGDLEKGEYRNYITLKKESDHYSMTEHEKKSKDKKFGKFLKNTKKQFRKHRHRGYSEWD